MDRSSLWIELPKKEKSRVSMEHINSQQKSFKAGFIGLVGLPNAGKSSLLNLLVKEKVAIVSPKPQTTRRRVVGIRNDDLSQIIFLDAPGFVSRSNNLNQFLQKEAQEVISDSDALVVVLSLDTEKKEEIEEVIQMAIRSQKPWVAVITKCDLEKYNHRIAKIQELLSKSSRLDKVILSSTLEKDRIEELEADLSNWAKSVLPASQKPLYDIELYTTHTMKDLAAEIIREKAFVELHQEIPFQMAVRITEFDESDPKIVRIKADLLVGKENHKPIVIGKGGAMIKEIGQSARIEISEMIDQKVFLELQVVVRENWMNNKNLMSDLGYSHED